MINIVNLYNVVDIKAWLENENNVYVGRANHFQRFSKWGNPYELVKYNNNRQLVIDKYKRYVLSNVHLSASVDELKGKVLGCWCAPSQCHAEVLHQLAGNNPIYDKMSHEHFTRRSNQPEGKPTKPAISPKPVLAKPGKLSIGQLQEKIENLETQVLQLIDDSMRKDEQLKKMNERIIQLEADELKNASYLSVQKNVSTLLSNRVSQLEQYTRRYSVVVSGVKRKVNETKEQIREEVDTILQEADSTTSLNDVDKCHRNGPPHGEYQDVIVRFKTHQAKEAFYKQRKNIRRRNIKIKPSLSSSNYNLLKDAREEIKSFTSNPGEYDNPPEFVFANIHGELQVKLTKKTKDGTMFYTFNSLQRLYEILFKFNQSDVNREYDLEQAKYDDPNPESRSVDTTVDALDADNSQSLTGNGATNSAVNEIPA